MQLFEFLGKYKSLKPMNRKFLITCLGVQLSLFCATLSYAGDVAPTSAEKASYSHVLTGVDSNGNLNHNHPQNFPSNWRQGVVTGYHLGFRSLADEARELRRPSEIPVTDGFLKSLHGFSLRQSGIQPSFLCGRR